MSLVCQGCIQSPEHFDDTKCCLWYRLRCITTRRRYCSDNGKCSFSSFFSKRNYMSGTLIKLSQTTSKISRISFFTWHLFQTSWHLTKCLSPTGCWVCHKCYRISHITEILCYCNSCVNGCLTSCNRHIRCICDQNSSLHQRLSCLRVLQFRELVQNVCHLVSTLSTSDVDNNICLSPFCKLMLDYCLSTSERSRNGRNTALGDWEECVDNTLSCYKWHLRWKFLLIRTTATNRPLLHHS